MLKKRSIRLSVLLQLLIDAAGKNKIGSDSDKMRILLTSLIS